MTYTEALEYIHGVNWTFCKPGLDRIKTLCEGLGNPQNSLKFIHVAGTNGKGSFCSMTESVLRSAGYKTGLFTSPYIVEFNERMRVNGENISNEELAEITECVRPIADGMKDRPTEFELITAIAFEYFKRNGCQIVVLEAGMGGRLDSTNVITTSILSVITGISLDHTAYLGDTVSKIAAEKAGIIKRGVPVIFGGEDGEAADVIKSAAKENNSSYATVDYTRLLVKSATLEKTVFDYKERSSLEISLLGMYQPRNAALVITAMDVLSSLGFNIKDEDIRRGVATAVWHSRFEVIAKNPTVIFDGAHNPEGISAACESIVRYFGSEKVVVLSGVLADKDYKFIANKIARVASCVFTLTPDNPRALKAVDYAAEFSALGISAVPSESLSVATECAYNQAKQSGSALVVLGSLYTYKEVRDKINELNGGV